MEIFKSQGMKWHRIGPRPVVCPRCKAVEKVRKHFVDGVLMYISCDKCMTSFKRVIEKEEE